MQRRQWTDREEWQPAATLTPAAGGGRWTASSSSCSSSCSSSSRCRCLHGAGGERRSVDTGRALLVLKFRYCCSSHFCDNWTIWTYRHRRGHRCCPPRCPPHPCCPPGCCCPPRPPCCPPHRCCCPPHRCLKRNCRHHRHLTQSCPRSRRQSGWRSRRRSCSTPCGQDSGAMLSAAKCRQAGSGEHRPQAALLGRMLHPATRGPQAAAGEGRARGGGRDWQW